MRVMGLDVGSHTIGVALSDELGMTAQGLKTIRRRSPEEDLKELAGIVTNTRSPRLWSVCRRIWMERWDNRPRRC